MKYVVARRPKGRERRALGQNRNLVEESAATFTGKMRWARKILIRFSTRFDSWLPDWPMAERFMQQTHNLWRNPRQVRLLFGLSFNFTDLVYTEGKMKTKYWQKGSCLICGVAHGGDCDPTRIATIEAHRQNFNSGCGRRKGSYTERLADGCNMLDEGGWDIDNWTPRNSDD